MYFVYFSLAKTHQGFSYGFSACCLANGRLLCYQLQNQVIFKKNSQQIYTWDQKGYKKCGFVKDIAPSKTNPAIQPRFISVGVPKHHNMLIALFPKHLKAENIETHWKKILSKIGDIESSFIYPAAVSIINSIFRTNYDSSPLNFFS